MNHQPRNGQREIGFAEVLQGRTLFQIGIAPIRIDVLTSIDGVSFDEAWEKFGRK